MKHLLGMIVAGLALGGCVIADVETREGPAGAIQRQYASPTAFYAKHIIIPPGYATIRLPGIIPDEVAFGKDTGARTFEVNGDGQEDMVSGSSVYLKDGKFAAQTPFV